MSYTGTCANRFYWNCVYCCRNFRPLKRDLIKLLVEAAKAGDEKELESDMSIVDAQGNSPLHYACEANTSDVAKFLMENGHKVRVYNKYNGKFQLCNSIFKIKYYIV